MLLSCAADLIHDIGRPVTNLSMFVAKTFLVCLFLFLHFLFLFICILTRASVVVSRWSVFELAPSGGRNVTVETMFTACM